MPDAAFRRTLSRRSFVVLGVQGIGSFGLLALVGAGNLPASAHASGGDDFGPLGPPDANDLRLPPGFRSRIVARTAEVVGKTGHVWHRDPDGGAVFATDDGGWIYVSNSEAIMTGRGGVGAIRFDAQARIVDAYSILVGTTRNCAGGRTPWKTWLSCEEHPRGQVFECDPLRRGSQGVPRPALGVFQHEAVAVDPVRRRLYLTEDEPDGLLYRFTPERWPRLDRGRLEVARVADGDERTARSVTWLRVPDPLAMKVATRHQVPEATRFRGGEGIDYQPGGSAGSDAARRVGLDAERRAKSLRAQPADRVVFSTKGDDRIWSLDVSSDRLEILYDRAHTPDAPLSGVDNVFAAPNGDVYVAEDGGDLQIVALTTTGKLRPIVQVVGQPTSELTGPALSPDGRRLYFSSQRDPGTTYEVEGPFLSTTVAGCAKREQSSTIRPTPAPGPGGCGRFRVAIPNARPRCRRPSQGVSPCRTSPARNPPGTISPTPSRRSARRSWRRPAPAAAASAPRATATCCVSSPRATTSRWRPIATAPSCGA
ncbi:PhoX family protein [Myxococcota bacterium]|nr:PhoX family protein [Myxococcota bacterium]